MAINQNFQQQDFFSRSPRDVSKDVVDWSEITGKFVDFINLERDRRMAAKAEIDKNISTTLATMDNLDVGMDVDFNNFMFEGANNMRQYLLTQEKLLKSNQISVAEFKRNLTNTEGLVTNFKNYTTQYNEAVAKRDRMRMGVDAEGNPIEGGPILSEGDGWLMQHTGRYMDFGNAELVVGRDGTGGVVFTTGDPNRPYDISSTQSMGNLLNLSQQMFTVYDVQSDVKAFVDEIGKATQGNIRLNTTSEKFNEAYIPAKNDYIESIVESPEKLQSLASDYLLKGDDIYEMYTTDESKMDDENALVFVTRNGYLMPAMNSKGWENIKTKAREFLSNQIDVQTEETTKFTQGRIDPDKSEKEQLNALYGAMQRAIETGDVSSLNLAAQGAGNSMTFDPSTGTATFGGRPYNVNDPVERMEWFEAAGTSATGRMDLAEERYKRGAYASAAATNQGGLIEGLPPESYDDEASSSNQSSPSGVYMIPTGSGSEIAFESINNPNDLNLNSGWDRSAGDEGLRRQELNDAFGYLSGLTSGEAVKVSKDGNTWVVKDADDMELARISDGINGAEFNSEVYDAYDEIRPLIE